MKIEYEVNMSVDLPEEKAAKVIQAVEDFINTIAPVMPMPAISFHASESEPQEASQ